MQDNKKDIQILRDLAKQYMEVVAKPVQEERRSLWSAHFALKKTRPLILARPGMWNVWCREVFGDDRMKCQDGFFREHERWFRMQIFQDFIGDDFILEPWITQFAARTVTDGMYGEPWGAQLHRDVTGEGGSWKADTFIKRWDDVNKLTPPPHEIDEETTALWVRKIDDAVGDIIEVNVERGPILQGLNGDISTIIGALRGIQQLMIDMYESPDELRRVLEFFRDGTLAHLQQAEDAGDFSLTSQTNQAMTYADELERPRANSGSRKRKELWGFYAAQEYELVSPQFHDKFLFQYQIPLMEPFGLIHYGCCENLTLKIDMLRQLKNLRSIAVTPRADIQKCAEQIGTDYAISWRPNPAEMVCTGWDPEHIRKIIRHGLEVSKGCYLHIHLKDIETVQGDLDRLTRWVQLVRDTVSEVG